MSVAAVAENSVIGYLNRIPWPFIKEDMDHFRSLTLGHTVVMGRNTCQSLKNPLKNRTNIVITRDKAYDRHGFITVNNPNKVIEIGETSDVYIIGGQEIYSLFLPFVDLMYITKIKLNPMGDVFYPEFKEEEWNVEVELDKYNLAFLTYRRQSPSFLKKDI